MTSNIIKILKENDMKRIKNKAPPKSTENISSSSKNRHLVTSFFETAAPTFHEPLSRKRGLYSDDQEKIIKTSKESCDFREELLLSQRSRRRCRYQSMKHCTIFYNVLTCYFALCNRYAELLSQSTSCAMRRSSGVSLLIRPRTSFVNDNPRQKKGKQKLRRSTKLLTQTSTSELLVEEERELYEDSGRCPPIPLGSGTLGHMEALDLSTRYNDLGIPHPAATSSSAAVELFGRSFDDVKSMADASDDVSVWTTLDLPSSDLVSYMRGLADQRDQQQLAATAELNEFLRGVNSDDDENGDDDQQNQLQHAPPPPRLCLENSAAIAVSMLVEELLRDFMKNWRDRAIKSSSNKFATAAAAVASPLSSLSKRTLRAAARLQIQGCSTTSTAEETSSDSSRSPNKKSNHAVRLQNLLRNRLEVTLEKE